MGCCGQQRAATVARLRATGSRRTATNEQPPGQARHPPSNLSTVALRYVGTRPARARGTATGRLYAFACRGAIVSVDSKDLAALLRTGLFVRG
jgi:hypothetical protein